MQGKGIGAGLSPSLWRKVCAIGVLAAMAVPLAACGDDSDSDQAGMAADEAAVDTGPPPTLEESLANAFPPPKPIENAPPGSAAAIKAGREVCKGKTPAQIRDQFLAEASAQLEPGALEMVEEIERYEKQVTPNFVAGQLAAGVYEATLSENAERGGYQGCVYELAQRQLTELRNKTKSKAGAKQP